MPAGLRCWDSAGNLVLDVTSRLPRILGSFVAAARQSYQIALPGAGNGTYFVSAVPTEREAFGLYSWEKKRHECSISGDTLDVKGTGGDGTIRTQIIYGIF